MTKLSVVAVALGILALATAAPSLAETLKERMAKDPSIHLYNVEFRSTVDAHRRLLTCRVVKVIDGADGKVVTRKVVVAPRFVAAARAHIQHSLYLPHIRGQGRGPFYNAFLYSPTYPAVIIIDPDRPIDQQTP